MHTTNAFDPFQCHVRRYWVYITCHNFTAIGSKTTFYNMMDQGDPNALFDPEHDESEVQYLIKWKHWSHIHNTWESEASLREQKINGMKKLENFQKKQTDIDAW